MMNSEPTTCPDCQYPPNFIIQELPEREDGVRWCSIKCRDCEDYWEEPLEQI